MLYDIILDDNFQLLAVYSDDLLKKVYFTSPSFIKNYRIYYAHYKALVSKKGGQILSARISSNKHQDLFLKSNKDLDKNSGYLVSFRNQALELEKLPTVALTPLIESKFHSLIFMNDQFNIIEKKAIELNNDQDDWSDLKLKDHAWCESMILSFNQKIKQMKNSERIIFDGLDIFDACLIDAKYNDVIRINSEEGLAYIKKRAKMFWPNLVSNIKYHKLVAKKTYLDIQELLQKKWYISDDLFIVFEATSLGLNVDINIGLKSKYNKTSFYNANYSVIEKNLSTILDIILALNYNGRVLIDIPFISGKLLGKLVLAIKNYNKNISVVDSTKTGILELSVTSLGYPLKLVENCLQKLLYGN